MRGEEERKRGEDESMRGGGRMAYLVEAEGGGVVGVEGGGVVGGQSIVQVKGPLLHHLGGGEEQVRRWGGEEVMIR